MNTHTVLTPTQTYQESQKTSTYYSATIYMYSNFMNAQDEYLRRLR